MRPKWNLFRLDKLHLANKYLCYLFKPFRLFWPNSLLCVECVQQVLSITVLFPFTATFGLGQQNIQYTNQIWLQLCTISVANLLYYDCAGTFPYHIFSLLRTMPSQNPSKRWNAFIGNRSKFITNKLGQFCFW